MVKETLTARLTSATELGKRQAELSGKRQAGKPGILICGGTGCTALGAGKVIDAFRAELKKQGQEDRVDFKVTGCHGFCERGPLVIVEPDGIFYQRVKEKDVAEVISETLDKGKVIDRLLYADPQTKKKVTHENDIPFYARQSRLLMGNISRVDPRDIDDYIAAGGYASLGKAFAMSPQAIIDEVKNSGLRGRGGGGFPTGLKWASTRQAEGDAKYVICNCDEGDPGAYMDRSLMERNPHLVLEGMIVGAFAIGSHEGYIYIRHEYPLAVENAEIAIRQAEELGLLGDNILGSGFSFKVKINRGGGAFVCGESTALMASLEGKVGEPRAKYVHTSEKGLWEQPTNLNNVETWANVPLIINNGASWYSKIGTEGSKGTKIFSLVGKINNTGLVEVPMGMSLREIIFDIGGGIPRGRAFKAVQTGGPSGGVILESMLDLPVDFDELTKVGSMMGSGAMIVMDENSCMVDIAKYFVSFLEGESCGKCLPCREGLRHMRQILTGITEGKGKKGDIALLEELAAAMVESSLCALGSTAANPVLSTIRYFRAEYEAHIKEKRCPAGVCKALITFTIVDKNCPNCGLCVKSCPTGAITEHGKKVPVKLNQKLCITCGACYDACNLNAVKVT